MAETENTTRLNRRHLHIGTKHPSGCVIVSMTSISCQAPPPTAFASLEKQYVFAPPGCLTFYSISKYHTMCFRTIIVNLYSPPSSSSSRLLPSHSDPRCKPIINANQLSMQTDDQCKHTMTANPSSMQIEYQCKPIIDANRPSIQTNHQSKPIFTASESSIQALINADQ